MTQVDEAAHWHAPAPPHCDSRILHARGECTYCDALPEWQAARESWGIAFTGHEPLAGQIACPADQARPAGSEADHRRWGGNKPTSSTGDPTWPAESLSSVMLYGDKGGREPWPRKPWYRRILDRLTS